MLTGLAWAETYADPTLGVKLDYPSHWEVIPQGSYPLALKYPGKIVDLNTEHVRLEVQQLTGNGGLDMVAEMSRHMIESSLPNLKLVESKAVTFGNLPNSHRFRFEGTHMGRSLVIVNLLGMKSNKSYELCMMATAENYKKQVSYFDKMAASLKAD